MGEPAIAFEMQCERMGTFMMHAACIRRQQIMERRKEKRRGWNANGEPFITTDECIECPQGLEIKSMTEKQSNYLGADLRAARSEYSPDIPEGYLICKKTDCAYAGKPQPLDNFDKCNNKSGRLGYCKDCRKKQQKSRYKDSMRSKMAAKNNPLGVNLRSASLDSLSEAFKIINGARQDSYGSPEDSFAIIADFWKIYLQYRFGLKVDLKAIDTAHMMSLFKHARMLGQSPCRDNYIDAQGYLAIAADRLLK